jgi:hypothetical protein
MAMPVSRPLASTSRPFRTASLSDEVMVFERQATDLRVGLAALRRELASALRDTRRRVADLDALDTSDHQRARLLTIAAVLAAVLVTISLVVTGGLS